MTVYQLLSWKMSDFSEELQTVVFEANNATSVNVPFCPKAEASHLLVEDCPECANHVVLAEDFVCESETYSKGSKLVIGKTVEILGTASGKILVCRISGKGQIVFSSIALNPGQTYTMKPVVENLEQKVSPVNFSRGTLIETPHGPLPIERLEDGDEVLTRDGGIQLINKIGLDRYCGLELVLNPQLRPVCIQAGALLGGLPGTDLIVAQQHRLLLDDWRAAYFFGEDEILVPATALLNQSNVTIECPETGIDYLQITLEQPDLISANGIWAEASAPTHNNIELPEAEYSSVIANQKDEFHITKSDSYAVHMAVLPHESAASLAA